MEKQKKKKIRVQFQRWFRLRFRMLKKIAKTGHGGIVVFQKNRPHCQQNDRGLECRFDLGWTTFPTWATTCPFLSILELVLERSYPNLASKNLRLKQRMGLQ